MVLVHGVTRPLNVKIQAQQLWSEDGWSMRRISAHLDVPRSTVYGWLAGLTKGEASIEDSTEILKAACNLFDRGLSYGAIAVVMGEFFGEWYSSATWAVRIRRTGRTRTPRGARIYGLRQVEQLPSGGRYWLRKEAYNREAA